MSNSMYTNLFYTDAAAFLFTAVAIAWQKSDRGLIRLLRLAGVSLATLPFLNGLKASDLEMILVSLAVLVIHAVVAPTLIARVSVQVRSERQSERTVNSTSVLLLSGISVMLAYLIADKLTVIADGSIARALPISFGVIFISVILLITRRQMASTLIAFLLFDDGISAVTYTLTGGVPSVIELGVLLDVVSLILVMVLLAIKIRPNLSIMEIDELKELHE